MKLVEILARELKVWPKGVNKLNQSIAGMIFYIDSAAQVVKLVRADIASDWRETAVTRAQWEAERAKLKAPKANGDGWIRHRGGKCPVESGTLVDVRYRDGDIFLGETALEGSAETWTHTGCISDIMAYRIRKPVEQLSSADATSGEHDLRVVPSRAEVTHVAPGTMLAIRDRIRDRIRELDTQREEVEATYQRQISEITQERESLVQKLAGEGLALVEVLVQPVEDMSDPANWLPGDKLEVIDMEDDSHGFETGEIVEMLCHDTNRRRNAPHCKGRRNDWWVLVENLKWHSRPAS